MEVHLPILWFYEFQGIQEEGEEGFVAVGSTPELLDLFLC